MLLFGFLKNPDLYHFSFNLISIQIGTKILAKGKPVIYFF